MNDLRFAFRQLLKNPGFTCIAIFTLALGIGSNAIVFSWIRAVLLDSVPGASQAHRLVVICPQHISGRITDTMSFPDNRDLAGETNVFSHVFGSCFDATSLRTGQEVEWIWAQSTTANFFEALGVQPLLGRFFLPEEDQHPGGDAVAVLSYALWQRRFGGDPKVIGSTVDIANRPFTIIGVAPAKFYGTMGGLRFDAWIPITMAPEYGDVSRVLAKRNVRFLHTYARLQTGVNIEQAQAAAITVMKRLESEYPDTNRDLRATVLPVWKSPFGGQAIFLPLLRSLMFVTALLLLLVTANVANLLLARATTREQEMAVRLAMGAPRGRLLRQLLTESVFLAALGGLLGCLLAAWGVEIIFRLMPSTPLPIGYDVKLNATVLGFTLLLTVLTGILFGLAPAWYAARTNLNASLKQSGGRSGAVTGQGTQWLRRAFVVSEIGLALVLLVGMVLCARSLHQARKIDLGLDPTHIWGAGFRLPPVGYDDDRTREVYARLRRELAALPGVESVALADWLPLGFEGGSSARFNVDGYQPAPGESMTAGTSTVSPGYFKTLRVPILAGREFQETDVWNSQRVAVINELLATKYFAGRNPLGLKIRFWESEWLIVGVAKNGKYRSLNEPQQAYIYVAEPQVGDRSLVAIVRTKGDPIGIGAPLERTAMRIDPHLKPVAALTMENYTAAAFAVPRLAAFLLGGLGFTAALLAALGIYGVMAYTVNQRTREIGIRMALGAQAGDVLAHFLKEGLKLTSFGLAAGAVGAFAVAQLLVSVLVGVRASDPLTYALVALGLAAVALLACYLPAKRATHIDPMVALRYE
ncbi:MAG: ABC transporter permease [Verrucomicrobiota bacterium]